jgi:hypothetical protein
MRCLSDVELQAVADGEASESAARHVTACAACRDRVEAIQRTLATVAAAITAAGEMPAASEARVREAIVAGNRVRGATALRSPSSSTSSPRTRVLSLAAAAVVILVVMFGVLPRFGDPTTLSAAEVLGRSLEAMSASQGIEQLEYELLVEGPTQGAWRIEQLIDHELPTRYRVAVYDASGTLEAALSQDPVRQRRAQLVRVDGRNYIVSVGSVANPVLALPQMARALMETAVTIMQATSDQKLTVVAGPDGNDYMIELPSVTASTAAATPLDLHRARAIVAGADFHIREFEAAGTLLRQPFSVSFKLLRRSARPSAEVAETEFEIEPAPGDVVLEGIADREPMRELLTTIIRELAKAQSR